MCLQCRWCRRLKFDSWVKKIPWRRIWQPTLICLHEKSHGQKSLAGYSPKGCKETDTTEWLSMSTKKQLWHGIADIRRMGKKNILPKQEQKKQESWWGNSGVRRYTQALRFSDCGVVGLLYPERSRRPVQRRWNSCYSIIVLAHEHALQSDSTAEYKTSYFSIHLSTVVNLRSYNFCQPMDTSKPKHQ